MNKLLTVKDLMLKANDVRVDVINSLLEAGSGHSAGPLGMADIFTILYFNVMRHDPKNPALPSRDRLVLSNAHICPLLYAQLAEAGYFPLEELKTLRKLGTRLHGHPHNLALPGLEASGGPLAQGTSIACGIALALKMDKSNSRVYLMMSDGELEEGQSWEALMFAAKYSLDNITAVIDRNFIQIDGNTEDIMPLEPLKQKLEAFNWNVMVVNGHDYPKLLEAFKAASEFKGKPTVIIALTTPGKGVSFMENNFEWHGKPPNKDEALKALSELSVARQKILEENP